MTDLRVAAQQALEALEYAEANHGGDDCYADSITALKAALAEPVQEPVAWSHNLIDNIITHRPADIDRHPDRWTPLFTAPPQRKPLTEEEIKALIDSVDGLGIGRHVMHKVARAIERAHGIGGGNE